MFILVTHTSFMLFRACVLLVDFWNDYEVCHLHRKFCLKFIYEIATSSKNNHDTVVPHFIYSLSS